MLAPPKPRRLDEPIAVSLEDLVPADHFYRHLEATLDLGFVRAWVTGCYAERGRPGIDPGVFFKLQLVMFFEGIRSERKLIETASLRLAHRWYLGYVLDEGLPDHSSLTRIRQRLGVETFERFFERVVDLCQEAGLVWGRELFFDATKVRADAAVASLVPRFYHEAKTHVADLFAADAVDDEAPGERTAAAGPTPSAALLCLPTEGIAAAQQWEEATGWGGTAPRPMREPCGPARATRMPGGHLHLTDCFVGSSRCSGGADAGFVTAAQGSRGLFQHAGSTSPPSSVAGWATRSPITGSATLIAQAAARPLTY